MEVLSLNTWMTLAAMFVGAQVTLIGAVWTISWGINKKITDIYQKIQTTLDLMVSKLEYHEQHDDRRFSEITNGLWEIRVQNASKTHRDNVINSTPAS